MPPRPSVPLILRLLYNHNPFYVISAACMVYALKLGFRPGEVSYIDPWALMSAMGGYTVLMAITGFMVVKLGQVWEDARTIFLVLLLLFLAISVTTDELLNLDPTQGKPLIYCGFVLAVLVTEGILLGLRIQLRLLFRLPYYLWLSLLYFFPLWVSPELTGLQPLETSWRLLSFPILAGAAVLTLLPAVWCGSRYCEQNGTPWSWPLFPWSLFVFTGVASLFRTYALTISFLPSDGMDTAFQPYFLIPILLAVLILLLEMGITERRFKLALFALNMSPLLFLVALHNTRATGPAAMFLDSLVQRCGSPIWMTALGIVALQLLGLARGVMGSHWRLMWSLAPLIWIGPRTVSLQEILEPQAWPLLIIGLSEFVVSLRQRKSFPALVSALSLSCALSVWLWDSPWFIYRRVVPYHLALLLMLLIGGLFRDSFARAIRIFAAFLLPVTAVVSLIVADGLVFSHPVWAVYLVGLVAVTLLCWWWTRDKAFLYSFLLMVIAGSGESIYLSLTWLSRQLGARVLVPFLCGVSSFAIAILISALKAGWGQAYWQRWTFQADFTAGTTFDVPGDDTSPPSPSETAM